VLPRDLDVSLICDNAEQLPFLDSSFDVATSLYLLHEVPPAVRTASSRKWRAWSGLAPGGGGGQHPAQRRARAGARDPRVPFPVHEPYYMTYVKDDLADRVSEAGLDVKSSRLAFLTKLVEAEKNPKR